MSLVKKDAIRGQIVERNATDLTPPRTPVEGHQPTLLSQDPRYQQAVQLAQQNLAGSLALINFQHNRLDDLARENNTLADESRVLQQKLHEQNKQHAEQLKMWEAFHCVQFTQWAGEKTTLDCAIEATKADCEKKIRDLKLQHEEQCSRLQGHCSRLQSALPMMRRKLDELSGAARTSITGKKDNKILRRMLTLRGVESSDLEGKLRSLVKEKFQLKDDLRFERQKNTELNTALAEYEEECKASLARYEVEHKAHQELKAKSSVAMTSYDEQVAKCNDEKAEKELYQKLCEKERAQYLAGKQQLEAELVAATAFAASETTAREKAETEHRGHVNSLADEISRLKMEAKNHEALHAQVQGKLNDANKRCKASDKQLENAKSKAESLKGQLAETTKEQELAMEERDRLRDKLKTIFGVAAE